MFKIFVSRDKKKNQQHASTVENSILTLHGPISSSQVTLFQNPQILRTISSEHDVIHTPAPFSFLWFIMTLVIVISLAYERKTAPNDYVHELKNLE